MTAEQAKALVAPAASGTTPAEGGYRSSALHSSSYLGAHAPSAVAVVRLPSSRPGFCLVHPSGNSTVLIPAYPTSC